MIQVTKIFMNWYYPLILHPPDPFGSAFLYVIGGILFVVIGLGVAHLLSPNRPNPEKLSSYECGEDPVGESGMQFNIRFYVVALIFLIFEVEILFLFPWATVFAEKEMIQAIPNWGVLALIEMVLFVGILLLGLIYVWIKKDLAWIKPHPIKAEVASSVPVEKYQLINRKYAGSHSPNMKKQEARI